MGAVDDAVARADATQGQARAELETLVRIPSISAEGGPVMQQSAEATAELLRNHGLENVRIMVVEGSQPFVLGEWMHAGAEAPTVLLYAHHDVQPPGIVENWASDPFEPEEREGRLFGRGSADDKAGAVAHAFAVSSWLSTGRAIPCNVRVLVEGEEEIGSPTLQTFLTENFDALRADVLVLADSGNWAVGIPGLTYSLRGLATADIELRALDGPQHSGVAGGAIPDPAMALARVLGSLVDEHGDLAFAGAFDGLRDFSPTERAPVAGFDDRTEAFARNMGLRPGVQFVGDPSTQLHERLWFRPCATVIGFDSHSIKGSSNQIVARAAARVSCRLGPGQDPDHFLEALRAHVEQHVPWGVELRFNALEGAPAWQTDPTGPAFDAARRALHAGFGAHAVLMGVGGSIPFVGPFAEAFGGIPALLFGPDDPSSNIHGENESLHLADWYSLIRSEIQLLAELAATDLNGGSRATR
jgi:acetylornithine deacetylase/succinyl-diaminopimelate desuccinylase-like protein